MKTTIIGILVALIIGGGAGYSFGNGMNDGGVDAKKLQDATTMMKEQSSSIQKMGEMMKSSGLAIQEMGMKYKDEALVSMAKDLEAVGNKYIEENAKATEKDATMKKSMN
ncbi:MAG: hypothetical protein Q7S81_00985 [bacterium]|nr:hypothetical protein [bacterium]